MKLFEIAQAFKNCNGDVKKSFKEHLKDQSITKEELENGFEG